MRRLLVSAVLSLSATACIQPPCEVTEEGNLYISSSDDLEATSGCTEISGNLTIQALAPTGLSGLENLTSVGGSLHISTYELTSLSGLENLKSVGGSLRIAGNDVLTSIAALSSLTSVGGNLDIADNYVLTSLSGLDNVTSVGGSLSVWGNVELPQCEADALYAQLGRTCDDCDGDNGTGECN